MDTKYGNYSRESNADKSEPGQQPEGLYPEYQITYRNPARARLISSELQASSPYSLNRPPLPLLDY